MPEFESNKLKTDATPARHLAVAKLSPRLSSPRPVPRAQIIDHIRTAEEAALVLVHGPAGFGKTTVMLQYFAQLRSRGVATGWLTLDRADNELVRFLTYMAEAFRAIDPGAPSTIGEGDAAVLDLAARLAAFSGRFVLFMDDFEVIESPVVLGLVRQLLEYLPPEGKIVVGSRTVPDIGLGRLRAHGKLLEIVPADLRFSSTETASFLRQQRGLPLGNDDILRLQQRTEGWPAALWLVSLALRDRADPQAFVSTFDGSNASITDYLVEDVLARQPAPVRDFLLRTSLLDELCAPLCDHVLACGDSAALLAHVERAHLFLVAQDADRRWYRYHPLFRGFLRSQLAQTAATDIPRLHRRASQWWLGQGRPTRAIDHALHCGDADYLMELLGAHAPQLLWEGRARTLARWCNAPQVTERLAGNPLLALTFAWSLTLTHQYDESMKLLDAVQAAQASGTVPHAVLHPAATKAPRAFILAMADRVKESSLLWQACLPEVSPEQPFPYAMLGTSYGFCLVAESRFDEARRFLAQARQRVLEIGGSFIAPMALCLEGAIDFAQGRLRNAITSFRAALASRSVSVLSPASGDAVAAAFLAEALYENHQLEEAEHMLKLFLPLLKEAAAPDQLISSFVVLARIASARAQPERADELLAEMEVAGHQHGLPRMVATARLERARLALLRGRIDFARDQLASASEARTWAPFEGLVTQANDVEAPFIGALRLRIRTGRAESTIAALKDAIRDAEAQQRYRRALKLNILLAEAQCQSGQAGPGMRRLRDALQFASAEGFVRSFVDEGPELVRRVADLRKTLSGVDPLASFADTVLGAAGLPPQPDVADKAAATTGPAAQALSERELQVLRLLTDGHRNREIADRMFVSETTVKAHLRSINVKLGAQSRTHAVAIARQLGLVA